MGLLGGKRKRDTSQEDAAMVEYLASGEGLPVRLRTRHEELARVWKLKRASILAEAKRRGMKHAAGECYDHYKDGKFEDVPDCDCCEPQEYSPDPNDPRWVLVEGKARS